MKTLWLAFRDTLQRRAALRGDAPLWVLGPYTALQKKGFCVRTNLESERRPLLSTFFSWIDQLWIRAVGVGLGDLERALWVAQKAKAGDVVVATSDTAGLALAFLRRVNLLKAPLAYTSIGFLERWARLARKPQWRDFYRRTLCAVSVVFAHGWEETRLLREMFAEKPVIFLPYGCDSSFFTPMKLDPVWQTQVLTLGLDEQRDWSLMKHVAATLLHRSFRVIAPEEVVRQGTGWTSNVQLTLPVSPSKLREHYAAAQVIALPVRPNTYSGATTTLLQAMAMAKPVLVTRVAAIAEGYGFEEGRHLLWAPLEQPDVFAERLEMLLRDPETAEFLGMQARSHVCQHLTFEHMAEQLVSALQGLQLI